MTVRTGRGGAIEAGAIAGIAGLVVFLVLHHLWVVPIWFIAPVGAVMAALGGAAVGAVFGDVLPRLPPRPWTSLWVMAGVAAILTPSIVAAELSGPIYAMGLDGEGTLLVSAPDALAAIVVGLLGTATLTGAALGATIGRTRRAAATMALAGLALAVGPGHNIPLLGGTPAAVKELAVLAIVVGVASVVLVESQTWMTRWAAPSMSESNAAALVLDDGLPGFARPGQVEVVELARPVASDLPVSGAGATAAAGTAAAVLDGLPDSAPRSSGSRWRMTRPGSSTTGREPEPMGPGSICLWGEHRSAFVVIERIGKESKRHGTRHRLD